MSESQPTLQAQTDPTPWREVLVKIHRSMWTQASGAPSHWPLENPTNVELQSGERHLIAQMQSAWLEDGPAALEATLQASALALAFDELEARLLAKAWCAQSLRQTHFNPFAWPSELQDFEQAWHTLDECDGSPQPSSPKSPALGLYVVAPDAAWIDRLVQMGVPTVQLRLKSDNPTEIEREIRASIQAVQNSSSRLFINDHWRIALECGALGLHLGQEDMLALKEHEMAEIKNAHVELGLSTHGYAEMMKAHRFKPSYMALGAVFPTTLKRMKTLPQGLSRLREYAKLMHNYSLVAIGGIDETAFAQVMSCGVGSIAVVRAVLGSQAPGPQIKHLQELMGQ